MRLFDSTEQRQADATARRKRDQAAERAKQIEAILAETEELDSASKALNDRLTKAQSVQTIHYKKFRLPGSKWQIEHAQDGRDYVIQLFPLRPTTIGVADTLSLFIATLDVIFPRTIHIRYIPPAKDYKVVFYTVKILEVVGLPGWEQAVTERALRGLARVDAWQ